MKNPLISSNISISQSMKKLSETGQRCLVIVDIKKKLLGTLTDGDIRRNILSGYELSDSIKKFIIKNQFTSSKKIFLLKMLKKFLLVKYKSNSYYQFSEESS